MRNANPSLRRPPTTLTDRTLFARLRGSTGVAWTTALALLGPLVPISSAKADAPPPAPVAPSEVSGAQGGLGVNEASAAGTTALATANVDPATGILHASIPFELPVARGDVQPQFSLQYSSTSGNWNPSIPSIERRNISGPPRYQDPSQQVASHPKDASFDWNLLDSFTWGGLNLVPICLLDSTGRACPEATPPGRPPVEKMPSSVPAGSIYYRLEVEDGSLARFFWWPDGTRWTVQFGSGETQEYGVPVDDPSDLTPVDIGTSFHTVGNNIGIAPFRWNLNRRYDSQRLTGKPTNVILYRWISKKASPLSTRGGEGSLGYLSDIYDTPILGDTGTPALSHFAHHTAIEYGIPTFFPGGSSADARALPQWAATAVDVTSADYGNGGPSGATPNLTRQQVRRYRISNVGGEVASVQLEGSCDDVSDPAHKVNPAEGDSGRLPAGPAVCAVRPVTTFEYSAGALSTTPQTVLGPKLAPGVSPLFFDLDNDGLTDVISTGSKALGPLDVAFNPGSAGGSFGHGGLTLPTGVLDLTPTSFSASAPQLFTGAFLMDGRADMLWSGAALVDPSTPSDPLGNAVTYQVLVPTPTFQGSRTQWTLSAGQSFTGRLERSYFSGPFLQSSVVTLGDERPYGAVDLDGDGIGDLLTTFVAAQRHEHPDAPPTVEVWREIGARFSSRAPTGRYATFTGGFANLLGVDGQDTRTVFSPDSPTTFADIDADGLPDFVQSTLSSIHWRAGFGSSFGVPVEILTHGIDAKGLGLEGTDLRTVRFHDVTGDGAADMIVPRSYGFDVIPSHDGNWGHFDNFIAVNAGVSLPLSSRISFADMNGSGVDDVVFLGSDNQLGYVDMRAGSRTRLLTDIRFNPTSTNLAGSVRTHVDYAPSSDPNVRSFGPWTTACPQLLHLVTAVTHADSQSAYQTTYRYQDPHFDPSDNVFLGFGKVRETHPGPSADATENIETTYYYPEFNFDWQAGILRSSADRPDRAYRSLPILREVFNDVQTQQPATYQYLSTTHHSYGAQELYYGQGHRIVRQVWDRQTDTYLYQTEPGAFGGVSSVVSTIPDLVTTNGAKITHGFTLRDVPLHLQRTREVDQLGNTYSTTDNGRVADGTSVNGGTDDSITRTTVVVVPGGTDPASNWIFRPTSITVTGNAAGTPEASRTVSFFYDAHGNVIDVTAPLSGTILGRFPRPEMASQDGTVHLAHLTYDSTQTGNAQSVEKFPGTTTGRADSRCLVEVYDGSFGQVLTAEAEMLDGCAGKDRLLTQHTVDTILGRESSTILPGGQRTWTEFDGFGRPRKLHKPGTLAPGVTDDATTTLAYDDRDYGQQVTVSISNDSAPRNVTAYFDGFGRTIMTLASADPGETKPWIAGGQTARDAHGRITASYLPAYTSIGPTKDLPPALNTAARRVRYDAFGRTKQVFDIDGTLTATMAYSPLSVDTLDAENIAGTTHPGHVTRASDGHGRLTDVTEYGNKGAITTHREFLPTGEVTSITRSGSDRNGPVQYTRSMTYDSLGRLVLNVEPNTSTATISWPSTTVGWSYDYNDLGELVGTTDARGCGKNVKYDPLGRVLYEDFIPCSPDATHTEVEEATGNGTEAFYTYERIASPDGAGTLETGRVLSVQDRAASTALSYDARGRITSMTRKVAAPGPTASDLTVRYSPQLYIARFGYDDRDRLTYQSTGATVDELLAPTQALATRAGPSAVTAVYSTRDLLRSVQGSYGPLIASTAVEADGRPDATTYGDAAATTIAFSYNDPRRRLSEVKVSRNAAAFPKAQGTYAPPSSASSSTLQTVLTDDVIPAGGYDAVGNVLEIDDARPPQEWKGLAGYQPVSTRRFAYDDDYRVTSATNTYAGGTAGTDSYVPPLASDMRNTSALPETVVPSRIVSQSFTYDGLGNLIGSADDASAFFDRSLGAAKIVRGNQLAHAEASGGKLDTSYDRAGNLTEVKLQRLGGCTSSCTQLFRYDWDEIGQLQRARRWDFGTSTTGTPAPWAYAYPAVPTQAPAADVTYAYDAAGGRVLRSSTHLVLSPEALQASSRVLPIPIPVPIPLPLTPLTTYSVEIFPSLRLNETSWDTTKKAYVADSTTEAVYLTLGGSSFGRVVNAPNSPTLYKDGGETRASAKYQHVFLEIGDSLSSTSVVIDKATSELVERTTYTAYGAIDSDYRPARWENFREDYKFTGKEEDVELGLVYFGARYYSPQLGRWISPDPLTIHAAAGDLNPYAYVGGRVTTFRDPNGMCQERETGGSGNGTGPGSPGGGQQEPGGQGGGGGGGAGADTGTQSGHVHIAGGDNQTCDNAPAQAQSTPVLQPPAGAKALGVPLAGSFLAPGAAVHKTADAALVRWKEIQASVARKFGLEEYEQAVASGLPRVPENPLTGPIVEATPGAAGALWVLAAGGVAGEGIVVEEVAWQVATEDAAAEAAARFLVAPSGATIETGSSPGQLLMPGGIRIGQAGANAAIRVIEGGSTEATMMFEQLAAGGEPVVGYPGRAVTLPGGGFIGMRTFATSTGGRMAPAATIDLSIPGIPIDKLKFVQ